MVVAAVEAGLQDIGENRVQEAAPKVSAVRASATQPAHWHLVGHLQSNKAKAALDLFDTIESVDSIRIAQRVSSIASRSIPVFLEVQFARTPDRYGFELETVAEAIDEIAKLPNIGLAGLMTVAPLGLDAAGTRKVFRALREERDRLQEHYPELPTLGLSMGMTDDFPIAIEEGATVVRVGRAIFAD
jgi:pyridoxal phosphate enzyme (YggS family)